MFKLKKNTKPIELSGDEFRFPVSTLRIELCEENLQVLERIEDKLDEILSYCKHRKL